MFKRIAITAALLLAAPAAYAVALTLFDAAPLLMLVAAGVSCVCGTLIALDVVRSR